ncbi:MAG: vitamin K epoxide reductase family protein [Patescibacteria group bacterium]
MSAFALLFTLAAIGISEVVYLIRTRRAAEQPVCLIGGQCAMVLTSKYNKLFGFHNDVAGLLFYIAASVLTALLVLEIGPEQLLVDVFALMLAVASLLSLLLVYIQWRVLKAWCFWCLMSAFTVWGMACILRIYFIIY